MSFFFVFLSAKDVEPEGLQLRGTQCTYGGSMSSTVGFFCVYYMNLSQRKGFS